MNDNLQISINTLYVTFRRYPLAEKIKGCPHCELDDAESQLHTSPLNELAWDELGGYLFKAMTTFGDLKDFKHFLPRILELYIVDYDGAYYDFFIFLSKLRYAKWESWDNDEQKVIIATIKAWLDALDPNRKESEYEKSIYEEVTEQINEAEIEIAI